jgi:ankyrin repeat protein
VKRRRAKRSDGSFYGAIAFGRLETVRQMLWEGIATISDRDDSGLRALLVAVLHRQPRVARWLLEHGGSTITENRIDSTWP